MSDSSQSPGLSTNAIQPDVELDLHGLNCPLPILRTKLALTKLQPGQVVRALTTDPMSVIDYRVFCDRTGHELLNTIEHDDSFEFIIRCVADAREDVPGQR